MTLQLLQKLIRHKGSLWRIETKHVPGDEMKCPNCNGSGQYSYVKSDCSYKSWTETAACQTCNTTGRVSAIFEAVEMPFWHVTLSERGISKMSSYLDGDVFTTKKQAAAHAAALMKGRKAV